MENNQTILGHASFTPYIKPIEDTIDKLYSQKEEPKMEETKGKLKHLMIDLETLGKPCDSTIISIGAVAFDMEGNVGPEFEIFPTVQDQIGTRKIEWSTIQWWFKQDQAVRDQQANANRVDLRFCLESLSGFCANNLDDNFKVWANGASFDTAMLNHAYDHYGMETPWTYRNQLDCRTICWLSKISTKKYVGSGNKHSAVDDCKWQISWTVDAFKVIKS